MRGNDKLNLSSDKQKRALGRGLSALIPSQGAVPTQGALPEKNGMLRLPIESIRRDNGQPRKTFDEDKLKELSDSIKTQGLIQPILVRKEGTSYRIIAGERRWRAAQLAGLKDIPAVVREASAGQAFELALVENLQRADLNPIEEALGYKRLMDEFRLTQEQVSTKVSKDRSSVANSLRLLSLPDEVKGMLASGEINMGHARALLGSPKMPELVELARKVAADRLSVRETERLVKERRPESESSSSKKPGTKTSASVRSVVEELQRVLGTKVRLSDRGGKGTLEIDYFSYEDLDRLLALMRK
ncbi:MAG: ParB/RepB/Spo0J family partition protein [Myxococcaceae bacterium]